ncbi:hypothetical protein ACLK1S_08810 [Escherichia coli]
MSSTPEPWHRQLELIAGR